jgi:hypothetical protein
VGEAHQLVDTASMDTAVQAAIRRAPINEAISAAIGARLTESVTTAVQLVVDAGSRDFESPCYRPSSLSKTDSTPSLTNR